MRVSRRWRARILPSEGSTLAEDLAGDCRSFTGSPSALHYSSNSFRSFASFSSLSRSARAPASSSGSASSNP